VATARTRMDVDARREQLLDAGVALFAERSWEEVSIEEIASAGGVSRGLLYHYFAGKREYYVACIEHVVERLLALEPDAGLPAAQQLQIGLRRFFESIERHPEMHRALRSVAPADVEVAAIIERDRVAFTALVLAAMPGGGSGSPLARATARAWLGSVEAAGLDWLENRGVPAEQMIDVLSHGLTASMAAAAGLDPSIELPELPEDLDSRPVSAPRREAPG
jgi:AcrR family transcriptional regulator